jgi:hypothetical protein
MPNQLRQREMPDWVERPPAIPDDRPLVIPDWEVAPELIPETMPPEAPAAPLPPKPPEIAPLKPPEIPPLKPPLRAPLEAPLRVVDCACTNTGALASATDKRIDDHFIASSILVFPWKP